MDHRLKTSLQETLTFVQKFSNSDDAETVCDETSDLPQRPHWNMHEMNL